MVSFFWASTNHLIHIIKSPIHSPHPSSSNLFQCTNTLSHNPPHRTIRSVRLGVRVLAQLSMCILFMSPPYRLFFCRFTMPIPLTALVAPSFATAPQFPSFRLSRFPCPAAPRNVKGEMEEGKEKYFRISAARITTTDVAGPFVRIRSG